MPFDYWTADVDPLIASLLYDPRFMAMRAEVEARIDTMRRNVEAAESADDWSELRSLASQNLSAAIR